MEIACQIQADSSFIGALSCQENGFDFVQKIQSTPTIKMSFDLIIHVLHFDFSDGRIAQIEFGVCFEARNLDFEATFLTQKLVKKK